MKHCAIVQDLLPLYLDHMISAETKEYIEDHLQSCDACRKATRDLQKELQNMPVVPDSEAEIRELRIFKRFLIGRTLKAVLLSVLCAAVLLSALFVYMNHQLRYISCEEAGFSVLEENQDEVIFTDIIRGNYRWVTEIDRDTGVLTIHFEQTLWERYIDGIFYPFDHKHSILKKDTIKEVYVNEDGKQTIIWEATEDEKAEYFSSERQSLG